MQNAIKLFKAISDKNRLRILKMIEKKPLCVCEITSILGLAASTTSKHLSILKEANLIFEQKEGKWVNYHLNRATQTQSVSELLNLLESWLNDDKIVQKDLVLVEQVNRADLVRS